MKLAFVIQRYGSEVNGGSELHCRLLAERMSTHFEVEVLTTCALDYVSWKNHYKPGLSVNKNVKVRRFAVTKPRNINKFNRFSENIFNEKSSINEQLAWMDLQGPYCPDLINYLSKNNKSYDLIIFYTYLYWPTFKGLSIAPKKSIFIPTAHDEPPIYLDIFKNNFKTPKGFIYLTDPEKEFVNNFFKNEDISNITLGIGIDDFEINRTHQNKVFKTYNLPPKYILYAGRIAEAKGCDLLFDHFIKYHQDNKEIDLVLIGQEIMDIPSHPNIKSLGFVSNEDKHYIINGSELVVIPSIYESLSIIALEAWQHNKPILVNEQSVVLKDHCLKSNGGLFFNNYNEFAGCLKNMLKKELNHSLGAHGKTYVDSNYKWSVLENKLLCFLHDQTNFKKHYRRA